MYPVQYFHPEQRSVKSRCRCPWNAVHESYGRSKRVEEAKTGVAQSRWHKGPSPTRHRAYQLQERHKEGPSWSPCLKNLLEAGKYTRDGMIVFIFTSCVWDAKIQ